MPSSAFTSHTESDWGRWLNQLADNDFVYIDHFTSAPLYRQIHRYFDRLRADHEFSRAAIGTARQRQVETSVRGDFIYWLDRDTDGELAELFYLLDELVRHIRQQLFLSISDYEFHFALYPPDTFYKKHLDQFQGQDNRVLSVLLYLNDDWQPGDGGELKMYEKDGAETLIPPLGNRLLLFRSDTVEHEVLCTQKHRKSLTGWLLRRPTSLNQLI
ncbi:2OG-Fe(II) oxygenase [Fodinibius sediminis]|uniref:SM-20-related protein n=1 Tax=Fodinibius sediminis TaxID=1214077 RepID=A0A521BXS2_9BACT|nr:2OG-Fe(II) oxygenase [Fodinibius sediminis]SMO51371.1 SM-20-related protein [Fodinibius sediminis]